MYRPNSRVDSVAAKTYRAGHTHIRCRRTMRLVLPIIFVLLTNPVFAGNDHLVKIATRTGVTMPFYYMKREGAKATIMLLTGGDGSIWMKNGVPTSKNFLVRSRDLFAGNGFNVAVIGKPSDTSNLGGIFRTSSEHSEDLRHIAGFLKKDTGVPVWMVGTSMGTISATSAAIAISCDELSGIVLTSSIVSRKIVGAIPWQNLEAIRKPVLVVHHEFDECKACDPREVSEIVAKLKNAPIKKEVYVKGGAEPVGDPCEPMHKHGFIGLEKEVVDLITSWIKNPVP